MLGVLEQIFGGECSSERKNYMYRYTSQHLVAMIAMAIVISR